MHFRHISVKI